MFNTVYADVDGHIYYLFNGQIPVRESGDFTSWLAIQPGDDSSLIWNEYHSYEDLPKVIDPESGFVQNANEPPWTSTFAPALEISDYPPYVAPQDYFQIDHIFRPLISLQMLLQDDSITFDELLEYKHSTYVEVTDHLLDDLIEAARESDSEIVQEAAEVLASWDRTTDAESGGAILFLFWFEAYLQQAGFDIFNVPFDLSDVYGLPATLSDPEGAVMVLEAVAEQVQAHYGTLDIPYGDVMRLRVGEYDLPGMAAATPAAFSAQHGTRRMMMGLSS
jgi:acyl-homoserine-lactone acylase